MKFIIPRGVRLEARKKDILERKITRFPMAEFLTVPMPGITAEEGMHAEPGDLVMQGSMIAKPAKSAPTFSPCSGMIAGIKEIDHPLHGKLLCAVIEADDFKRRKKNIPKEHVTAKEVLAAAAAAGIIDEYDGIPLYKKLRRFHTQGLAVLVANAIDDEPFVCGSLAVLRECPCEVMEGLQYAEKVVEPREIAYAVGSRKQLVRSSLLKEWDSVRLLRAGMHYPARRNLKTWMEKNGKPVGFLGVQALCALGIALKEGDPQMDTVVTVAGAGVKRQRNLRVAIGTPLRLLLDHCGLKENSEVMIGSPVCGVRVTDLEVPVTAATRCVIAMPRVEQKEHPCIGCGQCERICPSRLMPWSIHEMVQAGGAVDPKLLTGIEKCRGCGACSMVCPSRIELAESMRQAALMKERGILR